MKLIFFLFGIFCVQIWQSNGQQYTFRLKPVIFIQNSHAVPFAERFRRNAPLVECFQPHGMRVSIADMPELESVRIEPTNCQSCGSAPIQDIEKPTNGRWVMTNPNTQASEGDQMKFKISCKANGQEHVMEHSYDVENLIPAPQDLSFPSGNPSDAQQPQCPPPGNPPQSPNSQAPNHQNPPPQNPNQQQQIPEGYCPCPPDAGNPTNYGDENVNKSFNNLNTNNPTNNNRPFEPEYPEKKQLPAKQPIDMVTDEELKDIDFDSSINYKNPHQTAPTQSKTTIPQQNPRKPSYNTDNPSENPQTNPQINPQINPQLNPQINPDNPWLNPSNSKYPDSRQPTPEKNPGNPNYNPEKPSENPETYPHFNPDNPWLNPNKRGPKSQQDNFNPNKPGLNSNQPQHYPENSNNRQQNCFTQNDIDEKISSLKQEIERLNHLLEKAQQKC